MTPSLHTSFSTAWRSPSQPVHVIQNDQTVSKENDGGISAATIAAGTVGGIVGLAIFILIFVCYWRRKTSSRDLKGEPTLS